MNKEKRGILYGLVLGDGNLHLAKNNFNTQYCKLTIGHSPKQQEYLNHKIDLLHSVLGGKRPKLYEYKSFNKQSQKEYTNIQTTKTNKYFKQMHRVLYPFGQKIFTKQCLNYLTDQGLALWFMDDGSGTICRNKQNKICGCMIRIATYCSLEEIKIIKDWFKEKYDIDIKFDCDKRSNRFSVRLNTKDSHKFISIVKPYIHKNMEYKINITQECLAPLEIKDEDIV